MDIKITILIIFHLILVVFATNGRRVRNRSTQNKPNIILFLTDDQDSELGSMGFMVKTRRIFEDSGVKFQNGFVSTPICCSSRSSILTGMYMHNHQVFTNGVNCSGSRWQRELEPLTFGSYVKLRNYRTAYFGKYLNAYNGSYTPPGWDHWIGLVRNSRFYNYTLRRNNRRVSYGDKYEFDYLTDLIANDSTEFLQTSKSNFPNKPILMVLSMPAPHGPEDPAPIYSNRFPDVSTHKTPSWNYAPNPDKQWLLQHTGKMEPVHVSFTNILHRRRLQTLLSVDDAVKKVVNKLRKMGQLRRTYLLFTSDHGYHLGQFGLVKGKNMPYEFDLKVPFYIRGPQVPRGAILYEPVVNIDLAPTILDIAGVEIPDHMDGQSFFPLLKHYRNVELGRIRSHFDHSIAKIEAEKLKSVKRIKIGKACANAAYDAPCLPDQTFECLWNAFDEPKIFRCDTENPRMSRCVCIRKKRRSIRNGFRTKRSNKLNDPNDIGQFEFVDDKTVNLWENEFLKEVSMLKSTSRMTSTGYSDNKCYDCLGNCTTECNIECVSDCKCVGSGVANCGFHCGISRELMEQNEYTTYFIICILVASFMMFTLIVRKLFSMNIKKQHTISPLFNDPPIDIVATSKNIKAFNVLGMHHGGLLKPIECKQETPKMSKIDSIIIETIHERYDANQRFSRISSIPTFISPSSLFP